MDASRFDNLDDYYAAQHHVIEAAARSIDWLDTDLAESVASSAACATHCQRLLTASSAARIRLLLASDAWLWRYCPRLTALYASYSHAMEIRLIAEADQPVDELVLLTESAVVRRFHAHAPRGELALDGRTRTLARQRFEQLWQRAQATMEGRRLGI
jgi:hypothetical protein